MKDGCNMRFQSLNLKLLFQQLCVKIESLDANIALIHHNARLAGKISVEMKR
jgi:pseudouridine-5'-phosphate glycosidase